MKTAPIITRADYMNGKATHEEYYRSIVERSLDPARLFSEQEINQVRKALAAGDEHLNSIPLQKWDVIADRVYLTVFHALKQSGDSYSMAGGVCVVKRAAKMAAGV